MEPEKVDEDHKGPHILRSDVEKAIKEMREKKATGDDDVPVDDLRLLGDGGFNLPIQLINNIYQSGEWPKVCTELQWLH
jgi:hypothetical protein